MISLQEELRFFKKETINTYYNDALDLVKDNNISKAVELIEENLSDNTKDIQALNLMGICQYILCNFDKANLYWNKSLMYDYENNRARYYLNSLKSDRFNNFIEYYDLSLSYIDKFKYKDAIELLLEVNKTNKDLIEPYALIGNCYYALQETELAKQYLEQALTRDIDNLKYLKYLNKINSKKSLNSKKNKLNYKMLFSLMALFIAIISIGFYQKYNKDMKAFNLELDKSKSKNIKLEEQLKNEKHKNKKDKDENNKEKDENDNNVENNSKDLSFSGSETEIFEDAMEGFINKQYSKSIDRFQYLINKTNNEDLISESIYFLAVCFEKEKNHNKAGEYYNSYIDKYNERNYYDDSLYNYGLMLYEKGYTEESKQILYKLKKEVPDSDFINSKVKSILEK